MMSSRVFGYLATPFRSRVAFVVKVPLYFRCSRAGIEDMKEDRKVGALCKVSQRVVSL